MTDDNIMIKLEADDTLVDFAHKVAERIFETVRKEVHEIDVAAEPFVEARFGDNHASFLLLVLGHLAGEMTRYAAYMAAGIYMCAGTEDEDGNRDLAVGAVKALLKDQKKAAQMGLAAADLQAQGINEQLDAGKEMLDALLKKHKGAKH